MDMETQAIIMFSVFGAIGVLLFLYGCIREIRSTNTNSYSKFESPPVVVTSATHIPPGGYPVPQNTSAPATYQTNVYAAPYQPQMGPPPQMQMPMPMPMPAAQPPAPGMNPYPYAAPYPPMNTAQAVPSAANMNPPTYDMAVGQPSTYEKQAPYNPNYAPH